MKKALLIFLCLFFALCLFACEMPDTSTGGDPSEDQNDDSQNPPVCESHKYGGALDNRENLDRFENVKRLDAQRVEITCLVCGESEIFFVECYHDYGDALYDLDNPHLYENATRLDAETIALTCLICQESQTLYRPCNHEYGDSYLDPAPTCEEKGLRNYPCMKCNYVITEEISETGHNFCKKEDKEATCEEAGYYDYYYCSNCGLYDYTEIPRSHVMSEWGECTATCQTPGTETSRCQKCGYSETREIGPIDCIGVNIPPKAPTCTEYGHTGLCRCSMCGKDVGGYAGDPFLPPTGHSYDGIQCVNCDNIHVSEGLSFTPNGDGTCTVDGYGTCQDTFISIPEYSPDNQKVTRVCLDPQNFQTGEYMQKLYIPATVTYIEYWKYSFGPGDFILDPNNEVYAQIDESLYSKDGKILYRYFGEDTFIIPESCEIIVGCHRAKYVLPGEKCNLKEIRSGAFASNSSLQKIVIPSSLVTIGNNAFDGCINLVEVDFSRATSLQSIGNAAFYGCTSLGGDLIFPDDNSLISIGSSAFAVGGLSSNQIKSIHLGINNKVQSIGARAFSSCRKMVSFSFGNNTVLSSLGEHAFDSCKALTSISLPASLTTIQGFTFSGCTSLSSVTLPSHLKSIGMDAFDSAVIVQISLPTSLEKIDDGAFRNCRYLTKIVIPYATTHIGREAFLNCNSLKDVVFVETNGWKLMEYNPPKQVSASDLGNSYYASVALCSTYVNNRWSRV